MNEFKFKCSTCGQNILAAHEWIGRQINCPSCRTPITITAPAPVKVPKKSFPVVPASPKAASGKITVVPPTAGAKPAAAAPTLKPPQPKETSKLKVAVTGPVLKPGPKAEAAPAKEPLRLAVLTPAIKLEMVRAVRRRIADEANWLPGKMKGESVYAAKAGRGETALVNVTSPEAGRFSMIGAFLLELRQRQTAQTAGGRKRFLDHEIPEAMRDVLHEQMSEEEREMATGPRSLKKLPALSHAQCLAVLDLLEERYSQRMEQNQIEKARLKLGTTRLTDLVAMLEKKGRMLPEDVATALYHELTEVRRRLDRLESRLE